MAKKLVYDINSPDGLGMYMDKVYSTPENAEIGFNEWKKRFEHQGYYRDNRRNMIPLNHLRDQCKMVMIEFDLNEFLENGGEFI